MATSVKTETTNDAARPGAGSASERIAAVYAKALVGAAQTAGRLAETLDELDAVVDEVLSPNPRFEAVLSSWLIPHEQTAAMLDRVFAGRISPVLMNFFKILSRHGRLEILREVRRQARLLFDRMQGRIHVDMLTAKPVDPAQLDAIRAGLAKALGGEPVIREVVSPDLIGGVVLRVGDAVYDGSVAAQLERLRQQMIDRSVHEIQSRRDRFRSPAGN